MSKQWHTSMNRKFCDGSIKNEMVKEKGQRDAYFLSSFFFFFSFFSFQTDRRLLEKVKYSDRIGSQTNMAYIQLSGDYVQTARPNQAPARLIMRDRSI